jgi:hypothetical protein
MIKSLNYTIMKKFYFIFLLLPLWSLSSAWAQSVKLIGSNFDTGAVTFTVDVGAATPTWVLVEYTTDPSPTSAIMSRATFTDELITPPSAGILAAEDRGFLLTSSATITAKLKDISGRFSWCGYAFGAPPNATVNPEGGYTLRGTPPFIVNGVTLADDVKTFGPGTCIESITDFTYHPEGIVPDPPAVTVSASAFASEADPCADAAVTFTAAANGGITDAMTYTWNIVGQSYTTTTNTYSLALSTVVNNTYTVRVVNANGCTSAVSNTGTVTTVSVIETRTVKAILGYPPRTDIPKSLAESVCEKTTYEWRRSGTGGDVTLMDSDELAYDITKDVDAINTPGTYYYRRYATLTAGTIPVLAEGTYTLMVFAPPPSPAGTATWLSDDGTIIWSGALRDDRCSNYVDRGSDFGYYYNLECANTIAKQNTFCSSPWTYARAPVCETLNLAWLQANNWFSPGRWNMTSWQADGTIQYWSAVAFGSSDHNASEMSTSGCRTMQLRADSYQLPQHCVASYNY